MHVHVDAVDKLDVVTKPCRCRHIQRADVPDHSHGGKDTVVQIIVLHVPIRLRRLDFHRQHQLRKSLQVGVPRRNGEQKRPVIRIHRLHESLGLC